MPITVHQPIVTDNIALSLDAGNPQSYSGTGSTWTDTVGRLSGTISGATWSNDTFNFDGSNDNISIPNNPAFHFGSGDFTVEMWANVTTFLASSFRTILSIRDSTSAFSPLVITTYSNDLRIYSCTASGVGWNIFNEESFGNIAASTWYQIVLTRSGNTFTKYLNATSVGTATSSATLWANDAALNLGESVKSMYGQIPIVRTYKGKGLSATEVQQNYDAVKGRFGL